MPGAATHTRGEMTGFRKGVPMCTRSFAAATRTGNEFAHPRKHGAGVLHERVSHGRSRLMCTRAVAHGAVLQPVCPQSCAIELVEHVTHPRISGILRNTPACSWRLTPLLATRQGRACGIARTGRRCAPAAARPLHTPGKVCNHPKTGAWCVPAPLAPPHAPGVILYTRVSSARVCCARGCPMAEAAGCVPET